MSRQLAMTPEAASDFVGLSIFDEVVPTPFVYIDLDLLERNIAAMAAGAERAGVGLRPHAKAHKTVEIAKRQLAAGAIGLTTAKLSEADAFIRAGVDTSYLVVQPFVGAAKVRWALDLRERCDVIVGVDDLRLAERLGADAVAAGGVLDVVLLVDATSYQRFGVAMADAPRAAAAVAAVSGLRLRGIASYPGNLYGTINVAESDRVARADVEGMSQLRDTLEAAGLPCDVVSTGNTPAAKRLFSAPLPRGITEFRPGNYVFSDREQIMLGTGDRGGTALSVVASVVSAPVPGRGVIDAGLKTLSGATLDFGVDWGEVVNRKGASFDGLWEECGRVRVPGGDSLTPGERLRVTPNHACEVPNLAEVLFAGRDQQITEAWTPIARGKVW
jgi:D-serine deaminase-like pyridoxal phosphate-dependent protein